MKQVGIRLKRYILSNISKKKCIQKRFFSNLQLTSKSQESFNNALKSLYSFNKRHIVRRFRVLLFISLEKIIWTGDNPIKSILSFKRLPKWIFWFIYNKMFMYLNWINIAITNMGQSTVFLRPNLFCRIDSKLMQNVLSWGSTMIVKNMI